MKRGLLVGEKARASFFSKQENHESKPSEKTTLNPTKLHFIKNVIDAPLFKNFLAKAQPSSEVKEEFKFEGFVVLGFFIMILYLFFENGLLIITGFAIMLFGFIPNFNLRRFLTRDIFILGFAISTLITSLSLYRGKFPPFMLSLVTLLYSLFQFVLYLERSNKLPTELPEKLKKFVPQINLDLTQHKRVFFLLNPYFWAGLAVIFALAFYFFNIGILYYLAIACGVLFAFFTYKIIQTMRKEIPTSKKTGITLASQIPQVKTPNPTDFDRLFALLENKKSLKISEIASTFNLTQEQAEKWAKIFDEHGLGQVHYPPVGEMQLKWKSTNTPST